MNLTQAIANKRKLGIACAYLLQEDFLDAESPPILKRFFSYNSDSSSISQVFLMKKNFSKKFSKETKFIPIKIKNLRVSENEAISELVGEVIMAGKAFGGGKKSVIDFVNSRAYFAQILDIQQDLILKIGNDEGISLLEGFGIEGVKDLNKMLSHVDDVR